MRPRFAFFGLSALFCGCNAVLGIESGSFDPLPLTPLPTEAGRDADLLDAGGDGPVEVGSDASDALDAADASEPDANDGGCGDTQNDPNNCGVCGHDCLRGTCQLGACLPFTVATGAPDDTLDAVAISPTHVFYTNVTTGHVYRVAKAGSAAQETIYTGTPTTGFGLDIAWRAGFLYFADPTPGKGKIVRCPDTGCVGAPETMLEPLDAPQSVALTSDGFVTSETSNPGRVIRCHALPCEATPEIVASAETRPQRVAVNGDAVAWTRITNAEGVRLRIGTDPVTTPVSTFGIFSVAITSTEVLYGVASTGVRAIPRAGGAPRDVAAATFVERFAIGGDEVFYADNGGFVRSVALTPGSQRKLVASGQSAPKSIAVDDKAVYWVNAGNATVVGIAR